MSALDPLEQRRRGARAAPTRRGDPQEGRAGRNRARRLQARRRRRQQIRARVFRTARDWDAIADELAAS